MKLKLLTLLLCSITYVSLGQSVKKYFIDFEKQYEGGEKAYFEWLTKNINYPGDAKDHDRQGLVVIGFILTKEAKIVDIKVKNSVGFGCDEEAIRVVKSMPKWKPGKQRGRPVKVRFTLPVSFKLE